MLLNPVLPTGIRRAIHRSTILLLAPLAFACTAERGDTADASPAVADGATASQIPTGRFAGTVTETMDAGSYTYVKLEKNDEFIWAAGPQVKVAVGDELLVDLVMPMPDFESPTIDRKFDLLYFVTAFGTPGAPSAPGGSAAGGGMGGAEDPHAGIAGLAAGKAAGTPVVTAVEKPAGGYQIAELWGKRKELIGRDVAVRGKVVKYNPNILGVNWIHIQDGSGDAAAGTHDLTVTTDGQAAVGDIVTVRGRLAADQDFGSGYQYALLVEKASVAKE